MSTLAGYSALICAPVLGASVQCLSARSAFHALLQGMAIPRASPIIYSAVTIETMVQIAQEHGLVAHFIDVSVSTLLPDPVALDTMLSQTRAKIVVIAQLFGCVSSLQALGAVCKKHGAFLVEDCAQAFSGEFHLGDAAADISLFSFGPIKRFTALGAGIALGRNHVLLEKLAAQVTAWPRKSETWFLKRVFKYALLQLATTRWVYSWLVKALTLLRFDVDAKIGTLARGFREGLICPQLEFQPSLRQCRLLKRRLESAKHSSQRASAAQLAFQRARRCVPDESIDAIGLSAEKNAFWLVPVLVRDPVAFVQSLRSLGLDATQGATSMRAFGSHCLVAQRIIRQVVYLPF